MIPRSQPGCQGKIMSKIRIMSRNNRGAFTLDNPTAP